MNITVFGGSQAREGGAAYAQARELGRLLAEAGHSVLTGGYIGTMEAVSRGVGEAGGHVIGVTCDEIEAWRPVKPNAWVQEERRFANIQQRMDGLIRGCDAAIALPGGPGTLTEVALSWNLMIIHSIPVKPLVLIGPGWKKVMRAFLDSFEDYLSHDQAKLIKIARDHFEACEMIKEAGIGI